MAFLTGNREFITCEIKDVAEKLRVYRLDGEEAISEPYRFTVTIACENADLDADAFLGNDMTLSFYDDAGNEQRFLHGVVNGFEYIEEGKRFTLYKLDLVPTLWLLNYHINCRIFQNKTIPEIISEVLSGHDNLQIQYDMRVQEGYQPVEYCVQYRESDLNFIARLMQQEGIFYFFEHKENEYILVIADHESIHAPLTPETLQYHEPQGAVAEYETVYPFHYTEAMQPGAVKLKDFNFRNPSVNLLVSKQSHNDMEFTVYDYPGRFLDQAGGERYADVQLQRWQVGARLGNGGSNIMCMLPGFTFTLARHPSDKLNTQYLLVKVKHMAQQPQVLEEAAGKEGGKYENDFQCIPAEVKYRTNSVAYKPTVNGLQTAIVVGPAGEEIYTDEYGRVKVQFHWDLTGTQDENSSCWIRVSQLWAGTQWGAMFLPRIGQEVIVDFLEGDIDKPIITGRVYHATNQPPYILPDEKTKSTIRSATSKGSETHNELLMEDKQDETQVVLSNAYGHKIIQDEKTQSFTIHTRDLHTIKLDDKTKQISITSINGHTMVFDDTDTENEGTVTLTSTTGYQIQLDDKNRKLTAQTADGHVFLLDDENKKIELTTTNGHSAVLDDDNKAIGLTTVNGHYLSLSDADDAITMEDSGGAHRFKIDAGGGGLLISTDSGSIDLEAPSGTITLKAIDIDLQADMDCKLAGMNIKAEAGMEFKASGTMTTCEASGINTVSGSLVKIN